MSLYGYWPLLIVFCEIHGKYFAHVLMVQFSFWLINVLCSCLFFSCYLSFLFQVMDYNINLGKHLLPLVVQVLKYCSCPQLRHYFQQPPRCSLWSLKPHIRQMWLKALLVILYKVSCCSQSFFGWNNSFRENI